MKLKEQDREGSYSRPQLNLTTESYKRDHTRFTHHKTKLKPFFSEPACPPPLSPHHPSDDLPCRKESKLTPPQDFGQWIEEEEERRRGEEELRRKIEEKVVRLEQEVESVQESVEDSEQEGLEVAGQLGGREGEKVTVQGREVRDVTLLLLGLTRRLARLEEQGEGEESRRSRLQQQLEEARELRRSIARRSLRVEEVVAAKLGEKVAGRYKVWLEAREELVARERQATDRLQLAREELARLRRS